MLVDDILPMSVAPKWRLRLRGSRLVPRKLSRSRIVSGGSSVISFHTCFAKNGLCGARSEHKYR